MQQSENAPPSRGSRIVLFLLVAAALAIAAYTLSSREEAPIAARDASGAPDVERGADVARELGDRTDGAGASSGLAEAADSPDEPGAAVDDRSIAQRYHEAGEAPPREEIPPPILEEFRRGTASISDERRELMARGMEEMPDRVRRDFEEAPSIEFPSDVQEAFDDPYPPMPAGHEEYFPDGVKRGS